ncbi:class I SAM-dependent methyltransferase [Bacteroidota bacterium]
MADFWEILFAEQGTLWEFNPSDSALIALDLFRKYGLNKMLIPGVGYGRNAKPFYDSGFEITGIEISKTAIELARKNGLNFKIHHGSLTDMPFNDEIFDGVFCYATLHLFKELERKQVLKNCYNQLEKNGLLFFNVVSTESIKDFEGKLINKNTKKLDNGIEVFFYNLENIVSEFTDYNIIDISKIDEPIKHMKDQESLKCFNVICKKV